MYRLVLVKVWGVYVKARRPRTAAASAAVVVLATLTGPVQAARAERRDLPASTPRFFSLRLHGEYQTTAYYCVPASTAMSLATFGVRVSQSALARAMKTTVKGTGGSNAARVMDGYMHPRRFDDKLVGDVVGHPTVLMDRVAYDVGTLHRAPVIQVWMEQLPWNRGKVKGQAIGHAIVAYGYDRKTGMISVFDPWRPTGGPHTLAAAALARTLQTDAGMYYISRL